MFEQALIFGMTPKDFWQGNPQDFYVYANAYIKKEQMKAQEQLTLAWINGQYTLLAVSQALSDALSGKKQKIFPTKPHNIMERELTPEQKAIKDELDVKIKGHNARIALLLQSKGIKK